MANSLQEQLLKLGLVDEKRVKETRQQQRKQNKQQQRGGQPDPRAAERERLQREAAAKAERDRKLNLQRQQEAERKAAVAQIKQLIEANRLPKGDGDITWNFVDGRKIRRLYVTAAVQQQLTRRDAFVVKLHGQYNIVPAEVAEKIRARDAACVIEPPVDEPEPMDEAYAQFQVPDDLIW